HHGQKDHAEALLQLGMLEKLVQDDLRFRASLQLYDNAHAVPSRLVSRFGDIVDDLFIHQLGNALHDLGLVDLVGNLRDDDRFAPLGQVLNRSLGAHGEASAPRSIGCLDSAAPVDICAGGKVGSLDHLQNLYEQRGRIVDQHDRGFDNLGQIVRWN